MLAAAVLALMLAASWWARRGLRSPHGDRASAYAIAALRQLAAFAAPALAALLLTGRGGAIVAFPPEFAAFARRAGLADWQVSTAPLVIGALLGAAIGAGFARWRWRRTGRRGAMLGEIGWIEPRNRGELRWTVLLSVLAGISEELFFRLALPLLVAVASGSAAAGLVAAGIAFGAVHIYQGWRGIAATTVMGALFAALYLASGNLWLAILAHVLVDLNSLVLRPAVTGAWRRA